LISDLGNILILSNSFVVDIYDANYDLKMSLKIKDCDFKLKIINNNFNDYLMIFYLHHPT
jgi:hypothetical protein